MVGSTARTIPINGLPFPEYISQNKNLLIGQKTKAALTKKIWPKVCNGFGPPFEKCFMVKLKLLMVRC